VQGENGEGVRTLGATVVGGEVGAGGAIVVSKELGVVSPPAVTSDKKAEVRRI
jgi:hypothetical protein